jgi:hypothetical protein
MPYPGVALTLKTGDKKRLIHRTVHSLVLETFVGPRPFPKATGSHIDGNLMNNRLENLAWESTSKNLLRRRDHGTSPCGEKNRSHKLTAKDVVEIRSVFMADNRRGTMSRLAEKFGVSQDSIRYVLTRKTWRHL